MKNYKFIPIEDIAEEKRLAAKEREQELESRAKDLRIEYSGRSLSSHLSVHDAHSGAHKGVISIFGSYSRENNIMANNGTDGGRYFSNLNTAIRWVAGWIDVVDVGDDLWMDKYEVDNFFEKIK